MATERDIWKQKYRELAQEAEQLQRLSESKDDQLSKVVSMLALSLQGNSAELDELMAHFRQQLLDSTDDGQFNSLSDSISEQVRDLDTARDRNAKSLLQAVLLWIQQLKSVVSDSMESEALTDLEQQGREAVEKQYRLPELISALVQFQHVYLSKSDNPAEGMSRDIVTEDSDALLKRVSKELLELIDGLYIPTNASVMMRQLVKQIESGISIDELPDILSLVTELVTKATSDSSKEFESYLLNLTVQLSEVQKFLSDNYREQDEAGAKQRELEAQVRSDVSKLSEAVEVSHDLAELKRSVSKRLVGIVKAMDQFRREEENRDTGLRKRYQDLVDKVELMEEETRQVKAHMEEERHRARTDSLTGLPNRTAYQEYIDREFERWTRYKQPFCVVVADLDLFKNINDNYGHLAGDKVLRLVGKLLNRHSRATDFVVRYGGEEFVIILPDTRRDDGFKVADKLRRAVCESPFNFYGKPVAVTMSFGVSEVSEGDSLDELFTRADKALYAAKQNGRNRTEVG